MKILFVCKWNVGRSQIGEELFNQMTKKNIALSAGTHAVRFQGQKLKDFALEVVKVLKEKNIDVSNKIPIQLTSDMVDFADQIIVMTDKADLPDFALSSNKLIFWNIEDGGGKDYDFHIRMRNKIEKLIKELILNIG